MIATATPSHWLPGFRPLSSSRLLASLGSISRRQSRNPGRLGGDPTIPARQGLYCVSSFTHGPRFCQLSPLDTSSNVFSGRTHTHRAEPLRDGMKHETLGVAVFPLWVLCLFGPFFSTWRVSCKCALPKERDPLSQTRGMAAAMDDKGFITQAGQKDANLSSQQLQLGGHELVLGPRSACAGAPRPPVPRSQYPVISSAPPGMLVAYPITPVLTASRKT